MKRIGLLLMSLLVVVALVLASCTPAAPEGDGTGQTVKGKVTGGDDEPKKDEPAPKDDDGEPTDTGPEMITNTVGKQQEKPQYGGTMTQGGSVTFVGFDPAYTVTYMNWHLIQTHDKLLAGDWSKSAQGTGETGFLLYTFLLGSATGYLAESYELPDSTTIIFNLRQGVHWQDKPPANGREFVADDVVFSFTRLFEVPESYLMATHKEGKRPLSITAVDKYTVEIKVPEGTQGPIFRDLSSQTWPIDPDIVREDGDHKDWRRIGGTGPFQLVDHVPNASTTYERNPNYWMKDPLTGMQLPYIDGMTYLVIPDRSTLLAAVRTGKIDFMRGLNWEEADQMKKSNPEMNFNPMTGSGENAVGMNTLNPPWDDIRVRKALALATNQEAIVNDFYQGNAAMLNYPVKDLADFQDAYTRLEDLSPEIQELWTHDVEKAKQLLAEAGYPNGFSTNMVVPGYSAPSVDEAEILKEQWAEAGIDVDLRLLEYGNYVSVTNRYEYDALVLAGMYTSSPYKAQTWGGINQARNLSRIEDDYLIAQYDRIVENFLNSEERAAILKETVPYILENAWYLQYGNPTYHAFWQPWLKGYNGEYCLGYTAFNTSPYRFGWIDQNLKAEMMGE
jgi:peptide/nickel transport system substrate-binding protein